LSALDRSNLEEFSLILDEIAWRRESKFEIVDEKIIIDGVESETFLP
jgi:hypothetical protein